MSSVKLKYKVFGTGILAFALPALLSYGTLLLALSLAGSQGGAAAFGEGLFERHPWLHLAILLPLLSILPGFWLGRRNLRELEQKDVLISHHEQNIGRTIEFAREIGHGNLDFRFVPVNGERGLASSLDEMREGLKAASKRESDRNEIMRRVSQVGQLLRMHTTLESLSEEVISFLVRELDGVVQGAFYLADESGSKLELTAAFAYGRKKHLKASFQFAQGLVGQAALEKAPVFRREIPDHYATISSGLIEDRKPSSLLLQPLMSHEEVFGVIELASFMDFTDLQQEIMAELSEIIARTVSNLRVNRRTRELLSESREMSRELGEQKQQLEEQAELMIQTQEELKDSNQKLGEQVEEVHRSQKKNGILLENASEIITICSEKGKVTFVSPSVRSIMGYFPAELESLDVSENVHPQDQNAFQEFFSRLLSYPEQTGMLKYRCFTKAGDIIWLQASGRNFLSDPVINGLVINTRDISVQRLAEKEQRMRAKMQALSENSLDIIVRIDIFSRCTYINPVISHYTDHQATDLINRPLMDTGMDESVLDAWKDIYEGVAKSRKKQEAEMEFPTPDGVKYMKVNAIPEFSESGDIESVLMVCHDITEARMREDLIRKKNKSISDSINYAYYIQSSLMPGEDQVREQLPQSFMFYEPKDVVSGDYPWMQVRDEEIYLGAMDCTGHGVPGALMSLIGYFLQNEIMAGQRKLTAGEMLDHLHERVVKALRQDDEDSKTRDGMDAAFCRINKAKRELHYAGAHRPLYHVSNGKLTVIKGDKKPVGGTQYGDRQPFKNHVLQMEAGDAVYFMTDGYPDQYGGPDGKQKYMSGRVKKLIAENTHLSIFQMGKLFKDSFYEWMGDTKQLDDVLIIGIKF